MQEDRKQKDNKKISKYGDWTNIKLEPTIFPQIQSTQYKTNKTKIFKNIVVLMHNSRNNDIYYQI